MSSNIQANATKKNVVSKVGSMPFEHAADLAEAIYSVKFCINMEMWKQVKKR